MNYQQFIEEVERRVKEKIKGNETITVYIHTAVKNNGKERKGITVSEKGIHISPTIYLEEYFQQFQEGKPIEKIVEKILQLYEEVKCRGVRRCHSPPLPCSAAACPWAPGRSPPGRHPPRRAARLSDPDRDRCRRTAGGSGRWGA